MQYNTKHKFVGILDKIGQIDYYISKPNRKPEAVMERSYSHITTIGLKFINNVSEH